MTPSHGLPLPGRKRLEKEQNHQLGGRSTNDGSKDLGANPGRISRLPRWFLRLSRALMDRESGRPGVAMMAVTVSFKFTLTYWPGLLQNSSPLAQRFRQVLSVSMDDLALDHAPENDFRLNANWSPGLEKNCVSPALNILGLRRVRACVRAFYGHSLGHILKLAHRMTSEARRARWYPAVLRSAAER